jgi:hypothetical protein
MLAAAKTRAQHFLVCHCVEEIFESTVTSFKMSLHMKLYYTLISYIFTSKHVKYNRHVANILHEAQTPYSHLLQCSSSTDGTDAHLAQ